MPPLGSVHRLAAMDRKAPSPLLGGWHGVGGGGGALSAVEHPAWLQTPPLGPGELLAL